MTDPILSRLCNAVSGPGMMAHMREFARWTKHAGTPEELESLKYVRARLDEYRYRTALIMHDAYISLPGPAAIETPRGRIACITHSFSRASPRDGVAGTIVDLRSSSADEFAAHDVRGKIVLVDGIASPAVSLRASEAGAIGQVHISSHQYLHEMCISPVWGSPTHATLHRLPRTVVVTIAQPDGAALRQDLAADPTLELTLHASVDTGWRRTPILEAILDRSGASPDEPWLMLSGHHDTWYYGVMDNGGANATMLEVARLCATECGAWKRGMRVLVWSGHSQGRYSSSTWYAEQNWAEIEHGCVAHVNVDSTGGKGNTVVADTAASWELAPLAREAVRIEGGQEFSGRRMARAGDESFWGIGVPAMFGNMSEQPATGAANASAAVFGGGSRLGHGTGWWWHTPHDTIDKIDADILVRDTRICLHAVWRLLHDAVLPLDFAEHARGLRAHLAALGAGLGGRLDLSPLVERAVALERNATALASCGAPAETLNRALIAVCRAIVPVDHTEGDRFEQDAALPQPPYPSLAVVRRLAAAPPESDAEKFLRSGAMRARNRVAFALDQANAALATAVKETADAAR